MKEEYISMRKTKNYNINWFYKYFLENGGNSMDLHTFHQGFQFINLDEVIEYLDSKFKIDRLYDRNGREIMILN